MNTDISITFLPGFVFIGVFNGLLLSLFFIFKKSSNAEANRFQGLLLLSLSLCILEQFLNMTGLIVKLLFITNTTEPLNLVIGPFLYFYVRKSLGLKGSKKELVHFVLPVIYFCYMWFDYVQTNEYKYNSFVNSYHPDWPLLDVTTVIPGDPLNLKKHLNMVTALQLLLYITLSLILIGGKAKRTGNTIFRPGDDILKSLRNMVIHIFVIVLIFIVVKLNFEGDLGDYFIGIYVAFFALLTTLRVMNDSTYFDRSASFIDITVGKYRKSSLTEAGKQRILKNIINEFEQKNYFEDNLASLSELSQRIGESPHHVSQVINEKMGKSFFELLATYRIEKAKKIFSGEQGNKLTIEEVSELVGYNSKTAFNNAFRKITGKTPSEYRNQ